MSPDLGATLSRGAEFAAATGGGQVTLEHLLAALCDDPDAIAVLDASHVDVGRLRADATQRIFHGPPGLPAPPGGGLTVSPDVRRILEAAAAAARGSRRRDINGAIVLAAIVGDARSMAAEILQIHGLTFDGAIRALQVALGPAPPRVPIADDVLARARERVQSRAAPSLREIMKEMPQPVPPPPVAMPPALDRDAATVPQSPAPSPISPQVAPAAPLSGSGSTAADAPVSPGSLNPERTETPSGEGPAAAGGGETQGKETAEGSQSQAGEAAAPKVATAPGSVGGLPPSVGSASGPFPSTIPAAPAGVSPQGPPHPQTSVHQTAPAEAPELPSSAPAPGLPFPVFPAPSIEVGGYRPGVESAAAPRADDFHEFEIPAYIRQRKATATPPPIPQSPSVAGTSPVARAGPTMAPPGMAPPGSPVVSPQPTLRADRPTKTPAPSGQKSQGERRGKTVKVEAGQLAENIPRAMRVGRTERVEIRIAKASVKALTEGLEGGGPVWHHAVAVTQAMSVRLRAPEGGFFIESASPETQWIENNLGYASDDFASWRFLITPQSRGWSRLQIIVSARTVGADGVAAETALPDQVIEVKVRRNIRRALGRLMGWTIAAVAGGALSTFGETGLNLAKLYMQKFMQ
jgi:hypothetical protein